MLSGEREAWWKKAFVEKNLHFFTDKNDNIVGYQNRIDIWINNYSEREGNQIDQKSRDGWSNVFSYDNVPC